MVLQDGVLLALNAIITTRKITLGYYPEIAKSKNQVAAPTEMRTPT
jgi:hypothetical protein